VKHLFAAAGEAALSALARTRTLYAFDFDGTLAPIVAVPQRAHAPLPVMRLLRALALRAPVLVLSGRARADLVARVPAEVQYLVGNHGNEGLGDDSALQGVADRWATALQAQLAVAPAHSEGVVIEDKGLTLSVHYRLARDRSAAARWIEAAAAKLTPAPRVIGGKLVFNLLPPGARDKFDALAAVAERESSQAVLFVGDDDTDELVFERARHDWVTVRVGIQHRSRARFFLNQQAEVTLLLDRLVRQLAEPDVRSAIRG
jgi:trehalose 6-phosphate phosphatase